MQQKNVKNNSKKPNQKNIFQKSWKCKKQKTWKNTQKQKTNNIPEAFEVKNAKIKKKL